MLQHPFRLVGDGNLLIRITIIVNLGTVLYSVQCTVYSVQYCTVYSVQYIQCCQYIQYCIYPERWASHLIPSVYSFNNTMYIV